MALQRSIPNGQNWFIDKRKSLGKSGETGGYTGDDRGMCFGVAAEGLMAYLGDEFSFFTTRYEVIAEMSADILAAETENAKQLNKKWSNTARKFLQDSFDAQWAKTKAQLKIKYTDEIIFEKELTKANIIHQNKLNESMAADIAIQFKNHFKGRREEGNTFIALLAMDAAAETVEINQTPWKHSLSSYSKPKIKFFEKLPSPEELIKLENHFVFAQQPLSLFQIKEKKILECKIEDPKKIAEIFTRKNFSHSNPIKKLSPEEKQLLWKEINQVSAFDITRNFHQDISLTLPLTTTKKIELLGGINPGKTFTGFYSQEELVKYFSSLRRAIQSIQPAITQPIALFLESSNHTITVGYHPANNTWTLINASQLPKKDFNSSSLDEEIANAVISAFLCKTSKKVAFSSTILFTTSNQKAYETCLTHWEASKEYQELQSFSSNKIHEQDDINGSWFDSAINKGELETAKQLLKSGANKNLRNTKDRTPLMIAATCNNFTMVKELLNHNVDLDLVGKEGETALYIAVQTNNLAMVKLLLSYKANPNIPTKENNTSPLIKAATNGNLDIVLELLAAGAKPDSDNMNQSPLFRACHNGNLNIAKTLLAHNANLHSRTKEGATPLFIAAQQGHYEIVEFLLKKGADPNPILYIEKATALHIAAQNGHTDIVSLLLENGANPNVNLAVGTTPTPLQLALDRNFTKIVKLLGEKSIEILEHKLSKIEFDSKTDKLLLQNTFEKFKLEFKKTTQANDAALIIINLKNAIKKISNNIQTVFQQKNYFYSFFKNSSVYNEINKILSEITDPTGATPSTPEKARQRYCRY